MSHPIAGASLAQDAASAPTWHRLGADESVKFLGVDSRAGLELQEARTRARSHGPNRLAEKPPRSPWILFLGQFKSPLILAAFSLEIDESTLTGESLPDGKQVAALAKPDTPLAERLNMTYMNTMVTRGRAEMLVTATGMLTEMGRLSLQLASVEEGPSPLQLQLDELGKRLAMIAGALVGLLFVPQLLRGDGQRDRSDERSRHDGADRRQFRHHRRRREGRPHLMAWG